jgi:SAM-dependent methyltransferase
MSDEASKPDPHPLSAYVSCAWIKNRDPILAAFQSLFPSGGDVLEIGSGSGAHLAYFAPRFAGLRFQPSDRDAAAFGVIEKNRSAAGAANIAAPVVIDLTSPRTWPGGVDKLYDVIFAINVFHIAPPSAMDGAAEIAARTLKPEGLLAVYGPFNLDGAHTSPSNAVFDRNIQAQNPVWGLRDVRDFENAANRSGLTLRERLEMPANNMVLVFERTRG